MEPNVLIFHGTGASSNSNWFPWLKTRLEEKNCSVFVPDFPHPTQPKFSEWVKLLEKCEPYEHENTVFVGHSLGGLFLLRLLEGLKKPIRASFLVAAPIGIKPILYYESDLAFSGFSFNWSEIKNNSKHFAVYHSNDDPYVSLENGIRLAKHVGVDLTFIPNAGHLNAESGYTKFELLLDDIQKIL